MFRKLTSAAAITVFGLVQVASAQWLVSPQYNEIQPSWSIGGNNTVPMQEYGLRPYVPYPGQPGHPLTGKFPQPMYNNYSQPLPPLTLPSQQYTPSYSLAPQPMGYQSLEIQPLGTQSMSPQLSMPNDIAGSGNEIIIDAEPLDGNILGVVEADGSLSPLPQLGSSPQLGSDSQIDSEMATDILDTPGSSVVGDNFGEPIVKPGADNGNVIVPEASGTESPSVLALEPIAPSQSPQEVIEAQRMEESASDSEGLAQKEANSRARKRIIELANALKDSEAQRQEQETQLKNIKTRLRRYEARKKSSTDDESKQKLATFDKALKERSKALAEAEAKLKKQNKAVAELRVKNRQLNKALNKQDGPKKDNSSEDSEQKVANTLQETTVRLREAEARIVKQDKAVAEIRKKNLELKKAVKAMEERVQAAAKTAKESKSAKSKTRTNAKKIAKLESDNAKLEEKYRVARKELASRKAKVKQAESSELSELRKKFVKTNREMVDLRRQIADANAAKERLEKRNELRVASDAKLKTQLAESNKATQSLELAMIALKKKMGDASSSRKKAAKDSETAKSLKKNLAKSQKENAAISTKLKKAQKDLELQKKQYAELKSKFIKAFEAEKIEPKEKLSSADKRKKLAKKREAEKRMADEKAKAAKKKAAKKSDAKPDSELSEKVKKQKQRVESLRDEMKKKMSEAENRIRAVGKKKIDSLLKSGKKKSSDEVKEVEDQVDASIKISNRKIRARYERKIQRLK